MMILVLNINGDLKVLTVYYLIKQAIIRGLRMSICISFLRFSSVTIMTD